MEKIKEPDQPLSELKKCLCVVTEMLKLNRSKTEKLVCSAFQLAGEMTVLEQKASQKATRDVIAAAIQDDIVSGLLNLGQRIPEATYAFRFKTSRTPVREAILSLSTLGLVDVRDRSGSYVLEFTPSSLIDLFDARFRLEASSVRYATATQRAELVLTLKDLNERMSRQNTEFSDYLAFHEADTLFHRALVEVSNNASLIRMYHPIEVCALVARTRLDKSTQVTATALDDHQKLVASIENEDLNQFEATLKTHLNWVQETLCASFMGLDQPRHGGTE